MSVSYQLNSNVGEGFEPSRPIVIPALVSPLALRPAGWKLCCHFIA